MIIKSLPLAINCISFGSALTKGGFCCHIYVQFEAALCECTCRFVCDPRNVRLTDELENKLENFPNIIPEFPNITPTYRRFQKVGSQCWI